MGNPTVELEGLYLVWSTISDSPATFAMTREELTTWHAAEYGRSGRFDFESRMRRLDLKGTSCIDADDADDTIWLNRAGPNEIPLSKAEIVEWFVRRKRQPTKKEIAARRAMFPKCDPCIARDPDGMGGRKCVCWGSGVRDAAGGTK